MEVAIVNDRVGEQREQTGVRKGGQRKEEGGTTREDYKVTRKDVDGCLK